MEHPSPSDLAVPRQAAEPSAERGERAKGLPDGGEAIGLQKGTCTHTLRHTFATELLEAGVDLLTIQKILGHASLSTTLLYTHVRRDHLQRVAQILDLLPLEEILRGREQRRPPTTRRRRRNSK